MSCGGNAAPAGLEFKREAFRGILLFLTAGCEKLSTVVASQEQIQNVADNLEVGKGPG